MRQFARLVFATILTIAAFSLLIAPSAQAKKPSAKVAICHLPPLNPDNYQTIVVSESALPDHYGHGDLAGPCDDAEVCLGFLDPQGLCVDRCVGMVADLLTRTCVSLESCDNSLNIYYDLQSELACYNEAKLTSGVPPDCQCKDDLCYETATCCADERMVCPFNSW